VVAEGNTVFDSRNNCNAIIETATGTLVLGCTASTIPSGVTSIGESAFESVYIKNVTIPEGVTKIGNCAFRSCNILTSVTLPESLDSIGNEAFSNSDKLTSINLPDNLASIGEKVFELCRSLTSISIPTNLTSIGNNAFSRCTGLTSIVVAEGNTVFDSRNNCNAIIETATGTLVLGCAASTIPAGVTSIGEYAFMGMGIESVNIPEGVTHIGDYAFLQCSSLSQISIPDSVTSIGIMAFGFCTNLPVIDGIRYADTYLVEAVDQSLSTYNIKEGTRFIGSYVFNELENLESVTIPASVTLIDDNAFYNCPNLTEVTNLSQVPQTISDGSFSNYNATLYVPAGCKSAYEAAEGWNKFTIEELDSPTGIEQLQSAASAPGKVMMGNKLMIQKMGRQYDLTGKTL